METSVPLSRHAAVIALPLLAILYSSVVLYRDFRAEYFGSGSAIPAASVVHVEGDTKRRPEERFRWFFLDKSQKLYEKDSVKTGPQSSVEMEIAKDASIEMGESSLIYLKTDGNRVVIDFAGGSLKVKGGSKKNLLLQAGGLKIDPSKGAALITSTQDRVQIEVRSGSLEVDDGNVKKSVKEFEMIEKRPSGRMSVAQNPLLLVEPADDVTIQAGKVEFEIKSQVDIRDLFLELSGNRSFSSPSRVPIKGLQGVGKASRRLSEGLFYWRVRGKKKGASIYSGVRSFQITQKFTSKLIDPPNHLVLQQTDPPLLTLFRWTYPQGDSAQNTARVLEVSRDSSFKKVEFSQESATGVAGLRLIESGRYFWRVRWGNQISAVWDLEVKGKKSTFEVQKEKEEEKEASEPKPEKPTPQKAPKAKRVSRLNVTVGQVTSAAKMTQKQKDIFKNQSTASTSLQNSEDLSTLLVPILWQPVQNTNSYTLSFFSQNGSKVREETIGDSDQPGFGLIVKSLSEAKMSYQITANLKNGEKLSSDLVPIKLVLAPPTPARPNRGSQVKDAFAMMTWRMTVITDRYEIQVAKDPRFQDIEYEGEYDKNYLMISKILEEPGKYYWRVRGVSSGEKSAWSEANWFLLQEIEK